MGGMQHDLTQGSLDGMLANTSSPFEGSFIPEKLLMYHETFVTGSWIHLKHLSPLSQSFFT